MSTIKMQGKWLELLQPEFEQAYMQQLKAFLQAEKQQHKVIYPPSGQTFAAFNETPFEQVKVVILGQDPYHGPGQAHGLCFSVQPGTKIPPSLVNIYKELHQDIGMPIPSQGNLSSWAQQGVLLLNATLSVAHGQAGSHQNRGWETFTDRAIALLNEQREHLVFMLWGSYAQKKGRVIDPHRHKILTAPHPSPLSAHRGFFGCRHFSQANQYLSEHQLTPIRWDSVCT